MLKKGKKKLGAQCDRQKSPNCKLSIIDEIGVASEVRERQEIVGACEARKLFGAITL